MILIHFSSVSGVLVVILSSTSGLDNYKETWNKNGMTVFKDFLKWYKNKDVVPTLEVMQKMI